MREKEGVFRKTLEKLYDIPIVGNIRGEGFFYGIELVKDKKTRESFTPQESERILRGFISQALFENGIYCRTDDRGDPVVQWYCGGGFGRELLGRCKLQSHPGFPRQ